MSQEPERQKRAARPGGEFRPPTGLALWPLLLVMMALIIVYSNSLKSGVKAEEIPYSTFLGRVRAGQIRDVKIYDRKLEAKWHDPADPEGEPVPVAVLRPTGDLEGNLLSTLDESKVAYEAKPPSQFAALLYLFGFFFLMWVMFGLMMRRGHPAERAMSFGQARPRQYVERDTKTTFDDVAGIEEPKEELLEIVEYLRSPDKYRRLGGKIPKGVLLVGAPGTGKTLLAKAVAGEAKVPFFSISGSDFVELFVGVGASRVRDLFRQAETHSPCIVFIDELDALGKARGASLIGGGHDEREQTLNQLLVEMDGFESGSSVILMGATNRPEILDPALMRPGRFDRQVMILPPDVNGREAILKVHARLVKMDPAVNLRQVAARTPGFVGADLANVVNEAALLAARREREQVGFADFDEAIDRVALGLERRSHVISDVEKRIIAWHEAGHALVATFCEHADPVHKISIIPRGLAGGATWFLPADDRRLLTRRELTDRLATLLGGRVAEELALEDVSSGAANDIERVTEMARSMVVDLGMSPDLGPISYESVASRSDSLGLPVMGQRKISEQTAQRIDAEVRRIVDEAHQQARTILSEHRADLDRLAEKLLEVEVLDRAEMHEVLGLPLPVDEHPPGLDEAV